MLQGPNKAFQASSRSTPTASINPTACRPLAPPAQPSATTTTSRLSTRLNASSHTRTDGEKTAKSHPGSNIPKGAPSGAARHHKKKPQAIPIEAYWNLEPYSAQYEQMMRDYATMGDDRSSMATTIVESFFDAINRRDLARLFTLIAESIVYENHALDAMLDTKQAVTRFYLNMIPAIPDGAVFVLDDVVDGGDAVGIAWHLELLGIELPMSRGLGMYKVNEDGLLTYIRDSPEQVLKMALPALSFGSPFIKAALPALLPTARDLQGFMRSSQQASIPDGASSFSDTFPPASSGPFSLLQSPLAGFMMSQFQGSRGGPSSTHAQQAAATAAPQAPTQAPWATQSRSGAASAGPSSSYSNGSSSSMLSHNPIASDEYLESVFRTHDDETEFEAASFVDVMDGGDVAVVNFSGTWEKDHEASESRAYDQLVATLRQHSGPARLLAADVEGLQVDYRPADSIMVSFITPASASRLSESYSFGGSAVLQQHGSTSWQSATCEQLSGSGVCVEVKWEGASLEEQYDVDDDGMLHVKATARVGGREQSAKLVYSRSYRTRADILAESVKRQKASNN